MSSMRASHDAPQPASATATGAITSAALAGRAADVAWGHWAGSCVCLTTRPATGASPPPTTAPGQTHPPPPPCPARGRAGKERPHEPHHADDCDSGCAPHEHDLRGGE